MVRRLLNYWRSCKRFIKKLKGPYKLKLRNLPYTYHDLDFVLPHAMFEILSSFVENEIKTTCWNQAEDDKIAYQELMEAYKWWQDYVKAGFDPDFNIDYSNYILYHLLDESMEQEKVKHMMNIVKHHRRMWS